MSKKTESGFFTSRAKIVFPKLRQVFVKVPIFYHFDLEHYIWVETNVSGYAIVEVLSQLILNNLGQWYLIAFFLRKMISA